MKSAINLGWCRIDQSIVIRIDISTSNNSDKVSS
jgi:hypothetical protein